MALIDCTECGSKISDAASACPQCGCPISKPINAPTTDLKKKAGGCAGVLFLGVLVVGAIAMFGNSGGDDEANKPNAPIITDDAKPLPDCLLSNITLPEVKGTTTDDERAICNEIRLTQGGQPPSSHLLVEVAKATFVFRANGYDLPPKDIAYQLMNIIEARGQANASDDVKFKTVETVTKMYVAWNGHITPEDVNAFLRNAGDEAHLLSDDGLTAMMATVLAAKKNAGEN